MATDLYNTEFLARLTVKRLAELNKTRAKVESLERRAGLASEYELERRKQEVLSQLSEQYASIGPQLKDMGLYITELKRYLQSVYDADLLGDAVLQSMTAEHCIGYAVRLVDNIADSAAKYESQGSYGVLELVASTLAMFSGRTSAYTALLQAGAVPALHKLLSPLFPTVVVINAANAVGNMSEDLNFRLSFRANGGVGALVRLLRDDVDSAVQTASAASLSLLASRDIVVQDSIRYLGGIDLLVTLLASDDTYLAEVARYCLLSLRRGNVKNQAEIITSVRSSVALAKDIRKLDAAAELLRFEEATPSKARTSSAASTVRSLIDELDQRSVADRPRTADSSSFRLGAMRTPPRQSLGHKSTTYSTVSSHKSAATRDFGISPSAASAKQFSSLSSPISGDDWKLGTSPLVEMESELLRKKHLARFSPEEVCLLLEEMGFDRLDLRGFRVERVDGYRLIGLSETELSLDLVLPRSKVRKVQALQEAVATFDRIATLPRQGRVSEIELRLYLAGHGAGSADVAKIVKLFRTLVRTDRFDFVTFWDFVTSYDWISQALRIYNIPC